MQGGKDGQRKDASPPLAFGGSRGAVRGNSVSRPCWLRPKRRGDVTIQKQIMELLEYLKEKNGLSFIFICHNLALVQMFCDRVLVLYEGKVVESGIPDDIINEPKEEYTQRLVDAVLS